MEMDWDFQFPWQRDFPFVGDFGWKIISNPNFTVQRVFPQRCPGVEKKLKVMKREGARARAGSPQPR